MKNSKTSRRTFIKSVGMAGGLLLLEPPAPAQVISLFRCARYTRKNIKNLTAAEMTALKNGVSVMKGRAETNPISWLYQANIHGTFTTPAQTAWSTCKHNNLFFFSWHRIYLYYFERILRAASGSANFALPYWNYFDPTARQIPLSYRSPADATNPLWESNRGATMGGGGSLPLSAVDHTSAFVNVLFSDFSPDLEGTPHGVVHGTIGGGMGSFQRAGRDPVFWLHHCNIDRLWNRWLSQGGGRTNPVGDANWMNTLFTFFDETGTQVQMSGSQVVNAASQLNYCYDEERKYIFKFDPRLILVREWWRDILATSLRMELTAKVARIVLKLDDKARAEINRAIAVRANDPKASQLILEFEGVEGKAPEGYFEVYANLPAGVQNPDYRSPYYVGNLHFFGLDSDHSGQGHEKPQFRMRLTPHLRRMSERKLLNDKELSLTFVGRGAISAQGRPMPLRDDFRVRVERVTLSIERPR